MDYKNLFEYSNGELYWLVDKGTAKAGEFAGSVRNDGYVGLFIDNKYFFAHRIIWEMFRGPVPDGLIIDHIDTVRWHNQIDNLRVCTFQQNHFNRGMMSNNTSGYKGVSWHKQKQKWVAQIKVEGRNKFLGFFTNPETAYAAYCGAAIQNYGDFARLG